MRIIAGQYRGRKLNTPRDDSVRPTADRVRESIFNMLQWKIKGSSALDLFAGTGAMGLEAMSRGAGAVFNDIDRESVALIKKNLAELGAEAEVTNYDYPAALLRLKGRGFDYIFLDPPYALTIEDVLDKIKEYGLLKPGGQIIYERGADKCIRYPQGYRLSDSRKYGKTVVDCLEEE